MLRHMRWAIASAVLLCAHGCTDTELVKLEALRGDVCSCKTAACAETAMKGLPAAVAARKTASTYRSQEVARAIVGCLAKLYEQDTPAAGPDAEE